MTATAREVELPKVNDMQCAIFYDIEIDTRMCAGHNLNDMGICSVRHFNIIVMHTVGNIGIKDFPEENFQQ